MTCALVALPNMRAGMTSKDVRRSNLGQSCNYPVRWGDRPINLQSEMFTGISVLLTGSSAMKNFSKFFGVDVGPGVLRTPLRSLRCEPRSRVRVFTGDCTLSSVHSPAPPTRVSQRESLTHNAGFNHSHELRHHPPIVSSSVGVLSVKFSMRCTPSAASQLRPFVPTEARSTLQLHATCVKSFIRVTPDRWDTSKTFCHCVPVGLQRKKYSVRLGVGSRCSHANLLNYKKNMPLK